jgi:predicted TIM-barrel fold metal-dependent hydrolase
MIIDMHTHVDGYYYKLRRRDRLGEGAWIENHLIPRHPYLPHETVDKHYSELTPERYIEEMNEAGIDKAVILGCVSDDYVYDTYIKKYPERFIAFADVRPLDEARRFDKNCLERLRKSVTEYGFKGVGELGPVYDGYSPSDRRLYPLYEKAVEYGVPVVIHVAATPVVSATSQLEFGRPYLLEPVADDFPELNIVAAHMGYPWVEELLTLMEKRKNVYTDIAHLCIRPRMLAWYLAMAKEYKVLDRVLFGTDTSCRPPKYYIEWCRNEASRIMERMGWQSLSGKEIKDILGSNAKKLLKLK